MAIVLSAASCYHTGRQFTVADLPTTDGWVYLGDRVADRFSCLPGNDTTLKVYQKGDVQLYFAYFVGQSRPPWAFWHYDLKTGETFEARGDQNADGIYESYIPRGTFYLDADLVAWGMGKQLFGLD